MNFQIDPFANFSEEHLLELLINVALWGFPLAIAGLILGIWLMRRARRRGWLQRRTRLWTSLTKLYYLYVPLVLMGSMGYLGGHLGAKQEIDRWVETWGTPLTVGAYGFLAELRDQQAAYAAAEDLDDVVEQMILQEEIPESPIALRELKHFHHDMLIMFLEEAGYEEDIEGLQRLLQEPLPEQLRANLEANLVDHLQGIIAGFFWRQYRQAILITLLLLLIPVAEYRWHQRLKAQSAAEAHLS